MKCPNCGAEVRANTECKYCGTFVERVHKHGLAESNQRDKKMGKAVMWSLIIVGCIFLFGTIAFLCISGATLYASFRFNDWLTSPSVVELESVKNIEGNITAFDYDGTVTIEYQRQAFSTKILDEDLLNWLKDTGRSLEGVSVLFSTNEDCEVSEIALSSDTFYVMDVANDGYILLRDDSAFFATAEESLELAHYYSGYMEYPAPHVKKAKSDSSMEQLLFAPVCQDKREVTVADAYSGEDISLCQIQIDQEWYYCSQEVYDVCEQGADITFDLYRDRALQLVFMIE